eukprot:scaffold7212_cov165-Cylindrotheca_fusiformis.AAC.6
MNSVISQLLVILGIVKTIVGQECVVCPDGITFPNASSESDGIPCYMLEGRFPNETTVACGTIKWIVSPACCPDQLDNYFKDNTCGWCPNGFVDPQTLVPEPVVATQMTTCYNLSALMAFVPDSLCSFYKDSEAVCCPTDYDGPGGDGDGSGGSGGGSGVDGGEGCVICPNGVTFPNATITSSGQLCSEFLQFYQNETQEDCSTIKWAISPDCCPEQLDNFFRDNACGWCPNGIVDALTLVPDPLVPNDMTTCYNLSAACCCYYQRVNSGSDYGCSFFKDSEATCCPNDSGDDDEGDGDDVSGDNSGGGSTTCGLLIAAVLGLLRAMSTIIAEGWS